MDNHQKTGRFRPQVLWLGLLAVIMVSLVAAGIYFVLPGNDSGITETADVNATCDLQVSPCQVVFSGGRTVELSIEPRPIKPVTPLSLTVRTEGFTENTVKVDFGGEGMNMGLNRPVLSPAGDHVFSGAGMLSVCTLDRMYWRATVLVYDSGKVFAAPFRFETTR